MSRYLFKPNLTLKCGRAALTVDFSSCFDLLPCYCFIRSKSLKALTWTVVKFPSTQCPLYEHNQMPCHLSHNSYILPDFNHYQTFAHSLYQSFKRIFKRLSIMCYNGMDFSPPQTCWKMCMQVSFVLESHNLTLNILRILPM